MKLIKLSAWPFSGMVSILVGIKEDTETFRKVRRQVSSKIYHPVTSQSNNLINAIKVEIDSTYWA